MRLPNEQSIDLVHTFGVDIIEGGGDVRVIKIPEVVYQIMFDTAGNTGYSLEYRQTLMLKQLTEFLTDRYPGWGLQQMIDLTAKKADEMNEQYHTDITWGMFCLIEQGVPHMQRRTNTGTPAIEDNTDPSRIQRRLH